MLAGAIRFSGRQVWEPDQFRQGKGLCDGSPAAGKARSLALAPVRWLAMAVLTSNCRKWRRCIVSGPPLRRVWP